MDVSEQQFVIDCVDGAAPFVQAEVERSIVGALVTRVDAEELWVHALDTPALTHLRTPRAVWLSCQLPGGSPAELMDAGAVRILADAIAAVRRRRPKHKFTALLVRAAGRDTPSMRSLRASLAGAARLPEDDDGDLVVRLRKDPTHPQQWQGLVRLSPRPLSARPWRTARYPGALNATIAACLVDALNPRVSSSFIDLTCGSGTIALEWLARNPTSRVVACDLSADALQIANLHQRQSRLRGRVEYRCVDSTTVQSADGTFDSLAANLPWGDKQGSHAANPELYYALLRAAHRVANPEATFAVLTHDISVFEQALDRAPWWTTMSVTRFYQGGHHPRLYLLRHEPKTTTLL